MIYMLLKWGVEMNKFPIRAALFGFTVGIIPSFFGIYLTDFSWWVFVSILYIIGFYIDHKYFDGKDMFEKRKKSNLDKITDELKRIQKKLDE